MSLRCQTGQVWVTFGDLNDYVLTAGEELEIQVKNPSESLLLQCLSAYLELDVCPSV